MKDHMADYEIAHAKQVELVRGLFRHLNRDGFTVCEVYVDEDDDWMPVANEQQALDLSTGVDEAYIRVKNAQGQKFWIYLVYGNLSWELVADYHDYHVNDDLEKSIESWTDEQEQRSPNE